MIKATSTALLSAVALTRSVSGRSPTVPPLSPSRLFGELAKYKDIFARILDDRMLPMDVFTKIHAQTISEYQLRYGAYPLEFERAVDVTRELWKYIQALYGGYGPLTTLDSQRKEDGPADGARPTGLFDLIYVSTAVEALSTEELERILDSSVRHNTPQDVTGMLLYAGGGFMQVLEGEEAAVDETFSRIVEDPRHTAIILLHRGPIEARRFAGWSMGFRCLHTADATAHPELAPYFRHGFDARRIIGQPGLALSMLTQLGAGQSRLAPA